MAEMIFQKGIKKIKIINAHPFKEQTNTDRQTQRHLPKQKDTQTNTETLTKTGKYTNK